MKRNVIEKKDAYLILNPIRISCLLINFNLQSGKSLILDVSWR